MECQSRTVTWTSTERHRELCRHSGEKAFLDGKLHPNWAESSLFNDPPIPEWAWVQLQLSAGSVQAPSVARAPDHSRLHVVACHRLGQHRGWRRNSATG